MQTNREKLLLIILLLLVLCIKSSFGNFVNKYPYLSEGSILDSMSQEILNEGRNSDTAFIKQKINYYAPLSGMVYLAWYVDNFPLDKSVLWNSKTRIKDNLLYTPMEAHGDTFAISLNVPSDSKLRYYFWITKNKEGHYMNFWDLQSSGVVLASDNIQINKKAIYTKIKKKEKWLINSMSWLLFLILSGVFVILSLIKKKSFKIIKANSNILKVVFIGISLAIFHMLARSEIIGIKLIKIYHLGNMVKIVRASLADLYFVLAFVIVFILALSLLKNVKISKLIYRVFLFLVVFSAIVAFINIETVVYLGKPLTFQWLYYSDFLGSNEAQNAISENLSFIVILNILAYCCAMLLMAGILFILYSLLGQLKSLKYIILTFLGLALIALFLKAFSIKETWAKGQSENAITTMVSSILNTNSRSTFFTATIPVEMEPFNPSQGEKLEPPFTIMKDHKVKNVLYIILESAGAVYFDGYGGNYQLSPNLNKYASQSLVFENMYSHAPETNRTLVSILASIYPYLSYKSLTQEEPDIEFPTLSFELKKKGYRTSFFSSADLSFQNSDAFLSHRGFDIVEDFSEIECVEEFKVDSNIYKQGNGIDDMCLSNRLFSWIDKDRTQNFFSVIWTVQGHYPYFFADEEEDFGESDFNFNRYLNCLKHDDELIGKVMENLEERGLAKSTLVIVTGDHGEAFGQHNQFGHGSAIYEENIKVPLYFINPILFNGQRRKDIAEMKDLAVTTLEILDIDLPDGWQGRDLLKTRTHEAFFYAPWSDYLFGYRNDNVKFIFNETRNTIEVYDLTNDPFELRNIINEISKDEISFARNRVAAWVQFQDNFIKKILKNEN